MARKIEKTNLSKADAESLKCRGLCPCVIGKGRYAAQPVRAGQPLQ